MSTAHLLGVPEDSPLAAPEGWGAVATNAVCAVALFACTCVILYVLFIYPYAIHIMFFIDKEKKTVR